MKSARAPCPREHDCKFYDLVTRSPPDPRRVRRGLAADREPPLGWRDPHIRHSRDRRSSVLPVDRAVGAGDVLSMGGGYADPAPWARPGPCFQFARGPGRNRPPPCSSRLLPVLAGRRVRALRGSGACGFATSSERVDEL
jgi:hypothetical protein